MLKRECLYHRMKCTTFNRKVHMQNNLQYFTQSPALPSPTATRRLTECRFIFHETVVFNSLASWIFSTFQSFQCFSRRMVQSIKNKYKEELYLLKSSWSNPNWFQFTHWRGKSQFPKSSIKVVIWQFCFKDTSIQYTNSAKEI